MYRGLLICRNCLCEFSWPYIRYTAVDKPKLIQWYIYCQITILSSRVYLDRLCFMIINATLIPRSTRIAALHLERYVHLNIEAIGSTDYTTFCLIVLQLLLWLHYKMVIVRRHYVNYQQRSVNNGRNTQQLQYIISLTKKQWYNIRRHCWRTVNDRCILRLFGWIVSPCIISRTDKYEHHKESFCFVHSSRAFGVVGGCTRVCVIVVL